MRYSTFVLLLVLLSINSVLAQRYWVGGSGNWNENEHWSLQSNGNGGASLPSSNDVVYFDEFSFPNSIIQVNLIYDAECNKIITNLPIEVYSQTGAVLYLSEESSLVRPIETAEIKVINSTKGVDDFDLTSVDVTCFGNCDGTITVTLTDITGITFPVDIRMRNPVNLQPPIYVYFTGLDASDFPYTISGLCASAQAYRIDIEDAASNTSITKGIKVLAPDEITLDDYTLIDESCGGLCDGQIKDLNIYTEATPIVSYAWSNAATSDTVANLCPGNYSLTITDNNTCTKQFDFTIVGPVPIVVDDSTYTPFICFGSGGGSIDVDASGGTAPLTYSVGGPYPDNNDGNFTGLAAGVYNVTITDDNSCSIVSGPYNLQANASITIGEIHSDITCIGDDDGSIDVTVNGGTAPYVFDWSGPTSYTNNIEDISNLPPGTYDLTVTDAVFCTGNISVNITEPNAIVITTDNTQNVQCNGGTDGRIEI
ncbi:MAG: SprB repeat-containing protein, partial [Bacteroidales bacterium]|nr:SprB repeat-containing protein [Bacteroidales bacterium]